MVIDDGWQCTEVDEPYRNIPTEQLKQQTAKLMKKTPAQGAEQVGTCGLVGRREGGQLWGLGVMRLSWFYRVACPALPCPACPLSPPWTFLTVLTAGLPLACPGVQPGGGDASLREAYLEGEMEALGQAAREIPAGTAMGAYLQEIRASGGWVGRGRHASPVMLPAGHRLLHVGCCWSVLRSLPGLLRC